MERHDGKLVTMMVDNLLREGGICNAELLVALNPTLRKYLRDRRLVSFLRDFPSIFTIYESGTSCSTEPTSDTVDCREGDEVKSDCSGCADGDVALEMLNESEDGLHVIKIGLTAAWEKELESYLLIEKGPLVSSSLPSGCDPAPSVPSFACSQCELTFASRNKLFSHIKKDHGTKRSLSDDLEENVSDEVWFVGSRFCTVSSGKVVPIARSANDLLLEVTLAMHGLCNRYGGLDGNSAPPEFPVSWIIANRKVKRLLHQYVRELPLALLPCNCRYEYDSPDWWSRASVELLKLLVRCDTPVHQQIAAASDSGHAQMFRLRPGPSGDIALHREFVERLRARDQPPVSVDMCLDQGSSPFLPLRDTVVCLLAPVNSCAPGVLEEPLWDLIVRRCQVLVPSKSGGRITLQRLLADADIRRHCLLHSRPLPDAEAIVRQCPQFLLAKTSSASKSSVTLAFTPWRRERLTAVEAQGACVSAETDEVVDGAQARAFLGKSIPECTIHRDEELLVLDKPMGVSMEEIVRQVQAHLLGEAGSDYKIETVSRLDQQTSGAVVIPLTKRACTFYTDEYKNRHVLKCYICIVTGAVGTGAGHCGEVIAKLKHVEKDVMKTAVHPRGKHAHTRYMCLQVFAYRHGSAGAKEAGSCQRDETRQYSVVLCQPLTGRTHQIRVHMAHIGHPLLGDYKYDHVQLREKTRLRKNQLNSPLGTGDGVEPLLAPRVCLHSHRVSVRRLLEGADGDCGGEMVSHATDPVLPADMTQIVEKLGPIDFLERTQILGAIDRLSAWSNTEKTKVC